MSWSESKIFRAFIADAIDGAAIFDLEGGGLKAALFNDTITPDRDALSAAAAYNAGVWLPAAEVKHTGAAGQWDAGGQVLQNVTWAPAAGGLNTLDANDTASGAATDLTNVFGALVYDNAAVAPVAKQALSFNAFGGGQSVTQGTFTVVWAASGVLRITV